MFAPANIKKKVAKHCFAPGGMMNFGMELEAVKIFFRMDRCSHACIFSGSRYDKTARQFLDGIAMAHPGVCFFSNAFKQAFVFFNVKCCKSIFTLLGSFNGTTEGLDHKLHAITDSKNGNSEVKDPFITLGTVFFINAGWPAR